MSCSECVRAGGTWNTSVGPIRRVSGSGAERSIAPGARVAATATTPAAAVVRWYVSMAARSRREAGAVLPGRYAGVFVP
jgi:hypothetical protein